MTRPNWCRRHCPLWLEFSLCLPLLKGISKHPLREHMHWKDTYTGRTHALEGHMLWKDTCSGRTHALELSVHCKGILIVGRPGLIFHKSIWVAMKTAGVSDVTPCIIKYVHWRFGREYCILFHWQKESKTNILRKKFPALRFFLIGPRTNLPYWKWM
jgi:hypothetical protein